MLMKQMNLFRGGLIMAIMFMLSATALSAQNISVTGKVVDEEGVPMEGVAVLVKGGDTSTGTMTDAQGTYTISAPSSAELVFMCLGYVDYVSKVPSSGKVNVTMSVDSQALEEVVVVGYGTQRKKDLTGGLTVVSDETLNMSSTPNLMDRLVGQVAGLSITTSDAKPGADQALLIRGQNSISGSNTPLIVLDGIPYEGSLADIDPNIIESMSVLKDASSVAIYGSRGSNGVILIQTKQGQKGSAKVTYKVQLGLAEPMQRIQTMGPNEYIRFKQDLGRLGTKQYTGVDLDPMYGQIISASERVNYAKGETRDWQDDVFRQSFTMDHQVSISGGTDKTSYMAAVSYLDNPGVVVNSNYRRVSVYANLQQTLNKWLQIGLTTQFVNRDTGGVTPNLEHAIKQSPYGIFLDETGNYYDAPMDYDLLGHPLRDTKADQKNTSRNMLINGFINITPLEGLSIKSQFGYNWRNNFTGTYYGRNTVTGKKVDGQASVTTSNNTDWTWENVVKYDKTFGKHHIDVTGLFSMQQKTGINTSESAQSFVNDDMSFYALSKGEKNITVDTGYWKESMISYMLRLNYGFADKYLFTLTGRADGASVFGRNNKYGFFPSAAFAWHLGDENFVRDNVTWINMLKIRLSYGANGNNAISRYQTLDRLYATNGVKYVWGDGGTAVNSAYLASDGVGNPDLKWETTYTANLGIDFSFFDSRLGGSIDMYLSNTKDLLMTRTVPIMNGYSKMWDNIGQTRNKGIEIVLNSQNIRKKDFTWSTDLNFFLNRDEIIDLRGDKVDDITNRWFIGAPLQVFYDYNVIGIWQEGDEFTFTDPEGNVVNHQTEAKPGDAKLEDVDGNGYIDENDMKIIGSKQPSFTMSMSNRFTYKNFYFSFVINGLFGRWMSDNIPNIGSYSFGTGNYIHGVKYWTPENPYEAEVPSPGYTQTFTHGYYKRENYVQFKNITLGYTVKKEDAKKVGLSGIDVNVSVNNLGVISNMRQLLNYDNTWFASYPMARSYMLGITLTF